MLLQISLAFLITTRFVKLSHKDIEERTFSSFVTACIGTAISYPVAGFVIRIAKAAVGLE